MRSTQETIGNCPLCGDDIFIFFTKAHKRLARCANEDCITTKGDPATIFGLPAAGKIEPTDQICPHGGLPIVRVVPRLVLNKQRIQEQRAKAYYWAGKPCFSCKGCEAVRVLKAGDLEENQYI